ncbi:MAG: dethiobiotin synthase [Myxococcales bacterium]|nr:dethiobiotin synthase [Myxococcales bacterium]
MTQTLFISGTGTGIGKTFVTAALARHLRQEGVAVRALKPIETGCDPDPEDALLLGRAAGDPSFAHHRDFYRERPALGPLAATLSGQPPFPFERVLEATRTAFAEEGWTLVEGAGGLLVPLTEEHTVADFVAALGAPLLLVAPDILGAQSHVLTALESAHRRSLSVQAIILNQLPKPETPDSHNAAVLRRLTAYPVLETEDPSWPDELVALIRTPTAP